MKKLSKLLAILLCVAMIAGLLAACGNDDTNSSNNPSDGQPGNSQPAGNDDQPTGKAVKIGVLVADGSGAEAMAFRSYYENYVAKQYNVEFAYSSQLDDAADEQSAIETFAAENCQAIISFSSYDRPGQIEACAEYKMYYAVATGMLSEEDFEAYKPNEYFLGQIGPDTFVEYNVGLAIGNYYKAQGVKSVALYVGFPDPAHVFRAAGILTGLGLSHAGFEGPVSGMDIGSMIYAMDEGTLNLNNIIPGDGGVTVTQVLSGAGFGGPLDAQVTALIAGDHPDVVIGVGMVSVFFASQLDTAGIPYADVDAFTSDNKAHFENGSMGYLAGKYGSSVGPVFALVYNAVNGNVIRDNGNAISLSQNYLVATSVDEFNTAYAKESGDSPIFSKDVLDTVIGNNVTLADFSAFVAAER